MATAGVGEEQLKYWFTGSKPPIYYVLGRFQIIWSSRETRLPTKVSRLQVQLRFIWRFFARLRKTHASRKNDSTRILWPEIQRRRNFHQGTVFAGFLSYNFALRKTQEKPSPFRHNIYPRTCSFGDVQVHLLDKIWLCYILTRRFIFLYCSFYSGSYTIQHK